MDAIGHPFQTNAQVDPTKTVKAPGCTITPKLDENAPPMKALAWFGKQDVRVVERKRPMVTDPQDVILRVTTTCICGSDLHLYLGAMTGMQKEDVMGHEFMGIVEDVGPEVQGLKRGDRVVTAFDIGCGACSYCHQREFTSCDMTNPSKTQEKMYGHRSAGLFGYSHLTGGVAGGQAEYVRVPFADVNCLKVPGHLSDDKVILLSDVLSTAWHANELGEVSKGDNVAIWGCGPVGILAAHCAQVRGANKVVMIDNVQYRLDFAKSKLPGIQIINFSQHKVKDRLQELIPESPDVVIEAVGFHYTNSLLHQVEMKLMLETDPSSTLNELIHCVRKSGRISIVGVYVGYTNHFAIGPFMEKGLTMKAGQTPVQKYWKHLLDLIERGELDPTMVITHKMPLTEGPKGYKIFNDKKDNCIKVVLKPYMEEAATDSKYPVIG